MKTPPERGRPVTRPRWRTRYSALNFYITTTCDFVTAMATDCGSRNCPCEFSGAHGTFHQGWDYTDRLQATLKHYRAWQRQRSESPCYNDTGCRVRDERHQRGGNHADR